MHSLKLIGLIAALMLSAAVVCAANMVLPAMLTAGELPAAGEAITFGAEALALLGLVLWLRSALRSAQAR